MIEQILDSMKDKYDVAAAVDALIEADEEKKPSRLKKWGKRAAIGAAVAGAGYAGYKYGGKKATKKGVEALHRVRAKHKVAKKAAKKAARKAGFEAGEMLGNQAGASRILNRVKALYQRN